MSTHTIDAGRMLNRPCPAFHGVFRFNRQCRIWHSDQMIASIAMILVILQIGSGSALVGIFHIGAVVLGRHLFRPPLEVGNCVPGSLATQISRTSDKPPRMLLCRL